METTLKRHSFNQTPPPAPEGGRPSVTAAPAQSPKRTSTTGRATGGRFEAPGPGAPHRLIECEASDLSAALWEERRHLTALHRLQHTKSPASGQDKTAPAPGRTLQELRTAGLDRALAAHALSRAWGLSEDPTLPEIIVHAHSQPWTYIFSSHLEALEELLRHIEHGPGPTAPLPTRPEDRTPGILIPRPLRQFVRGPQ